MPPFDIAIVGTGPAGMFAALTLSERKPTLRIAMFEKGPLRSTLEAQQVRHAHDAGERVNVTEGWGGAGAFSDGKFNLTRVVGGRLVTDGYLEPLTYDRLLAAAAEQYVRFGADSARTFGIKDAEGNGAAAKRVREIQTIAARHRMQLYPFEIMHLGTSNAHRIVEAMREELTRRGVEIITNSMVEDVLQDGSDWRLETARGDRSFAHRVILCPGRSGSSWLHTLAERIQLKLANNGVDIGVRVEVGQLVMDELSRLLYEAKVYFRAGNDDQLRTFCMCPNGRVAVEEYRDSEIFCVNGHTDPEHPSENCNFSILQTQWFTEPFKDPLAYGRHIAKLCTMLSGGVLVQRLGDLRNGKRSTPGRMRQGFVVPTCTEGDGAIPGDIGLAMPGRFVHGILHFLEALEHIAPGVNAPDTLLYAPEIKFAAMRVDADPKRGFETLPGLHVAGDGAGYTRGLNQASVMGMFVAEKILEMQG